MIIFSGQCSTCTHHTSLHNFRHIRKKSRPIKSLEFTFNVRGPSQSAGKKRPSDYLETTWPTACTSYSTYSVLRQETSLYKPACLWARLHKFISLLIQLQTSQDRVFRLLLVSSVLDLLLACNKEIRSNF